MESMECPDCTMRSSAEKHAGVLVDASMDVRSEAKGCLGGYRSAKKSVENLSASRNGVCCVCCSKKRSGLGHLIDRKRMV